MPHEPFARPYNVDPAPEDLDPSIGARRPMVDLLTAARLMAASYHKTLPPDGWSKIAEQSDWTGLDAVAYRKGDEVAVTIEGQFGRQKGIALPKKLVRWGADAVALFRRQVLGRYAGSGEAFVRALRISAQRANPRTRITLIGHSGGGGWVAAIGRRLGMRDIIAFGAGVRALRVNIESNNPDALSVEIDGDPHGDSRPRTDRDLFKVLPLDVPPGHEGRLARHLIDAYVAALEAKEKRRDD